MTITNFPTYHRTFKKHKCLTETLSFNSKFQLSKPKVHGVARHDPPKDLQNLSKYPAFFHWQGSNVGQVFLASGDATWAQTVKMGIISLLQLQREEGKRTEVSTVLCPFIFNNFRRLSKDFTASGMGFIF